MRHRRLVLSSLVVLPLVLFLIIVRQNSWRPRMLRVGAPNFTLDFSSDGKTLVVAHRESSRADFARKFQLWNVATSELQKTLPATKSHSGAVVLSTNQSLVAAVVGADSVKVWDVPTGQLRRTVSPSLSTGLSISSLSFSPDNHILAQGQGDGGAYNPPYPGKVLLWDVRTGALRHSLATGGNTVTSFFFSLDGRTLVGSGMYAVQIWDVQSGASLGKLKDKALLGPQVAFSSNGKTLATVDRRNLIELWDPRTGGLRHKLSRPKGDIDTIVLDSQGRTIASVSNGTGIPAPPPGATSFSYNGPGVPLNGEVNVWDTHTGKHLRTFRTSGQAMSEVAFSSDGQMLAASSDGKITVWQLGTGKVLREIVSGSKTVKSLAFAPDSCTLATGGDDGTARLWRIQ